MSQITLYETLNLLEQLGYPCVDIKKLRETFFKAQEPEEKPMLPPPPLPALPAEPVYKTAAEAKKALKKGELTVMDKEMGGYINVRT